MPEWSSRGSFETLAKAVLDAGVRNRVGPFVTGGDVYQSDSDPDVVFVSSDTARKITHHSPARAGKKDHMSMRENTKRYEVKLTDGTIESILANSVEETPTRIRFLGYVAGVSEFGNSGNSAEVISSLKDDEVVSYRVVPVPEQNDRAVGKLVYRVTHTDGTTLDVKADSVMHAPGADGQPGRYAIVTNLKGTHSSRTEYLVPESRVVSIERFGATTKNNGVVVDNKKASDKV